MGCSPWGHQELDMTERLNAAHPVSDDMGWKGLGLQTWPPKSSSICKCSGGGGGTVGGEEVKGGLGAQQVRV